MLNIVLFGPPGAGKGTQAEKLINRYNLKHISTGDLLRSEISKGSELGLKAKDFIDKGMLVPDEIVIRMIENFLNQNSNSNGFIFDGFPRTIKQAEALDKLLSDKGDKIDIVISLEVKKEELIKRLLNRGKISGRSDDQNIETIENRINVYNKETSPLIDFYKKQGKYRGIYGIGTIDEIFNNITKVIDEYLK